MGRNSDSGSIGRPKSSRIFPEEDCIYETILTLLRRTEKDPSIRVPNASAVGVKRKGDELHFSLYEGSNSFRSIDHNPFVAINIPYGLDRIDLFIRSAIMGTGNDTPEFPMNEFSILDISLKDNGRTNGNDRNQRVVFLKGCSPILVLRITAIKEQGRTDELGTVQIKYVTGQVLEIRGTKDPCLGEEEGSPFYRAESELMEAIIVATRYRTSGRRDLKDLMEKHLCTAEEFGGKRTRERVRLIRDLVYSSSSMME